jgi:hypothetical protein
MAKCSETLPPFVSCELAEWRARSLRDPLVLLAERSLLDVFRSGAAAVVVVAVGDEAVPALGDDVEDIGRLVLEVLRAGAARNCDLLIRKSVAGWMRSARVVTRYSSIRLTPRCAIKAVFVPI